MKKLIKINVPLILCVFAPLAACVSCGNVSAILGMTDTAGIILEDKEIFHFFAGVSHNTYNMRIWRFYVPFNSI